MATQFAPSVPTKRLAAPILSTDMSFSLNNYLSWGGVALVAADFQSTSARGVFRNTTNTQIEFFTFDPSTIAGPITILTRGNDYRGGTADGAQTKYNWPANSTLVELGSNPPAEAEDYVDKTSDQTITGLLTFTQTPIGLNPGAVQDASTTVKGIVKMSVAPVSATSPIVVGQNDPKFVEYYADTGGANAYVITPVISIGAYAIGQRFSFKAATANTTTSTLNINGLGTKTIVRADGATALVANDIVAGQIVVVEYDGTNFQLVSGAGNLPLTLVNIGTTPIKFGGTGADGALTITSGATNIDCANAAVVIKNYTSISITGTGSLTFSNPNTNGTIVILKSQGVVTLTSSTAPMIDMSGMGAVGGASATISTTTNGVSGSVGKGFIYTTNFGVGSSGGQGGAGAGGAITAVSANIVSWPTQPVIAKYPYVFVGAGGATGGLTTTNGYNVTTGNGGRGGGGLVIECAGAWNFTTASGISVAGTSGVDAVHNSGTIGGASGSGGGGAGSLLVLYNTLTANTGTVTVSGGTGAKGISDNGNVTGSGGGGSLVNAGNIGTTAASGAKSGGDGGAGSSLIIKNTEYA